nr:fibrobacter succinogenes major paralogous domain-containing protein [Bacteroidota bacterium]
MKFFYPLLIALFLSATILAQVPQAFNYQAAVRDNAGNVLINQSVSFRMSILQGSTSGLPVFVETHDTVTNQAGLVNLDIGDGNVEYGDFSGIKWQSGLYFLQTEIDTDGGINFQITGTTQLLSVPYSMYSGLSEGLELTDNNGKKYQLAVDTYGNLITTTQPDLACGQILVDPRDGQKYATVKIGTQCWMAQNLNTGVRISGVNNQSDDGIIQKYCYSNDTVYCDTYGGLYQWDEMMDYSTTPGTMGICPPTGGWHIPTDGDWCILEAYVDSTIICDDTGLRGTDGGNKLKEAGTLHWFWPNLGASNSSGFTALPGGIRSSGSGSFLYFQYQGYFWTSNKYTTNAWHRILYTGEQKVGKYAGNTKNGHSVRCVRGINSPPTSPSNPNPHDWAFNTPVNTSLSWSCTDPENDPITYNIYFGTDSLPPLVMSNKHDPDFTPGPLNFATYYFWKVCAQDDNGNLTEGPLWTFATAGDPMELW